MVKKSARRTRRTHSAAFKAQVALAALRDDRTMAELCKEYEVHCSQVLDWKRQLLEGAANVFGAGGQVKPPVDLAPLHAKIGQLARSCFGVPARWPDSQAHGRVQPVHYRSPCAADPGARRARRAPEL